MKILVTYSSKTGNTKKIAEAIHSSLPKSELKDISDVDNLDYDVILVGGWVDKATFDAKSLKFTETLKNRKTGFFFTLGAYPDSKHAQDCVENIQNLFLKNENEIVGHYFCQGAIDPKLMEWMSKLPANHSHAPDEARRKRWADAASHPDNNDIAKAKEAFIFLNQN
jgi:flavodoxin